MHKLSKYVWYALGESRPFGGENLFSLKLSPQQADDFFLQETMEIRENCFFLLFGLQLKYEERYCDGP